MMQTLDQLSAEYRPTMDREVLHAWAHDVVAAIDQLRTGQLVAVADDAIERVARAIMIARDNGGCIVKDWHTEARDNPHVEQAVRQAKAAIAALAAKGTGDE